MKTYTQKSNARRAAITALVRDRGLTKAEAQEKANELFTIRTADNGEFYPHFHNVRDEAEAKAAAEAKAEAKAAAEAPVVGEFTYCPHCEIHLSNGYQTDSDLRNGMNGLKGCEKYEYLCLACAEEFGPEIIRTQKAVSSAPTGTGVKIEKDRPEQNGIKRPSRGGKCAQVWDICDAFFAEHLASPKPKYMKEAAKARGLNENNAVIEMYQWRKFMGL